MTSGLPRSTHASTGTGGLVSAARFVVQFDKDGKNGEITFSEMSGITSEIEVAEYMSSGTNGVTLAKQFGKTKPATVVLKRGVDQDMTLWAWHADALAGKPDARRGCTLMLKDSAGATQQFYTLHMAWPSKLELGGFKAGGSEAIIATVTLTCEMIEVAPGGAAIGATGGAQ
ncbi:phage tail protein [Actinophytocola sp.]|uniref:phage tail protein n=1 Tax=Actinophytocola sp. TaxID=1872138 RepID=UPI00389A457D